MAKMKFICSIYDIHTIVAYIRYYIRVYLNFLVTLFDINWQFENFCFKLVEMFDLTFNFREIDLLQNFKYTSKNFKKLTKFVLNYI